MVDAVSSQNGNVYQGIFKSDCKKDTVTCSFQQMI
jgi:hypothetical protein